MLTESNIIKLILSIIPIFFILLFNSITKYDIKNFNFIWNIIMYIIFILLIIFKIILYFLNNINLPKIETNNDNFKIYLLWYFFIVMSTEIFVILISKYLKLSNYNIYFIILLEILYPFYIYFKNPSGFSNLPLNSNKDIIISSLKIAIISMIGAKYFKTYHFDNYKSYNLLIKYGILTFSGTFMRFIGQNVLVKLSDYYQFT